MINKSASELGTVLFTNGNRTTLHVGTNRSTGATIVWQVCNNGRPIRITGRNIQKLWDEVSDALNKGECVWGIRSITLCVAMPEIPRCKGDNVKDRLAFLKNKGLR